VENDNMQSILSRGFSRAAAHALAAGFAALACAAPIAFAQTAPKAAVAAATSTPPASPEIAAIRKSLEAKFPGADIKHVAKTDYLGLYEVMLDDTLVYTDPKVGYIFVGAMYDTATKQNLTDARTRRLNRPASRIRWAVSKSASEPPISRRHQVRNPPGDAHSGL